MKEIDHERKRQKLTGFVEVEYLGIPIVIEGDTINALRYLPPKKSLVGDRYKRKIVQVTNGVISEGDFELDENGKKIKLKSSESDMREYPEVWQGLCTETQKNLYSYSSICQ